MVKEASVFRFFHKPNNYEFIDLTDNSLYSVNIQIGFSLIDISEAYKYDFHMLKKKNRNTHQVFIYVIHLCCFFYKSFPSLN